MTARPPVYHCPRCSAELEAAGDVDGSPVYQCDRCTVNREIFGLPVEVALTFLVGPDGRPVEPADPTGRQAWS